MQHQNTSCFYWTARRSARPVRTSCCADLICISAHAQFALKCVRVAPKVARRSAAKNSRRAPKHAAVVRNHASRWRHKFILSSVDDRINGYEVSSSRHLVNAESNGPSGGGLGFRFAASFSFRRQLVTTLGLLCDQSRPEGGEYLKAKLATHLLKSIGR